jgi:hypothetical protein
MKHERTASPELLFRIAAHLLEMAGAVPAQFVTVAQLASWLGCDRETIRAKIRHNAIEAYFDHRFLQYSIPLAAAERLLAARGLTIPEDFATTQGVLALIPREIMITDPKKKPDQLTPFEQAQLEKLMAKLGGPSVEAMAEAATAERR